MIFVPQSELEFVHIMADVKDETFVPNRVQIVVDARSLAWEEWVGGVWVCAWVGACGFVWVRVDVGACG